MYSHLTYGFLYPESSSAWGFPPAFTNPEGHQLDIVFHVYFFFRAPV